MNYMRPFLKFTFWTYKICEKVCLWHQFNIINSYCVYFMPGDSNQLLPSLQSDISDAIWLSATIWNFFSLKKWIKNWMTWYVVFWRSNHYVHFWLVLSAKQSAAAAVGRIWIDRQQTNDTFRIFYSLSYGLSAHNVHLFDYHCILYLFPSTSTSSSAVEHFNSCFFQTWVFDLKLSWLFL